MTQTEILQQFKQLDKSSLQFPDQLTGLLYKQEYKECVPNLRDEEVVWLVNYLDNVLESLQTDPSSSAFRRCLRELGRICGVRQRLPQSYILESSLSVLGNYPVASGGSGDVYEGSLNSSKVCVKRLRIYAGEDVPGALKTFHREAVMWKRLAHPNIVPLFGITLKPLQLISAWMPGGELKEYIIRYPTTNRLKLLFGIADGLNYLHCLNIIHGDLKGPNILVDDASCPRITDFGLAMVAQNQDSVRSAQGDHGHTARWTAPEILSGEGTYSKEADVFSFAMVMVEVFTGQVPFHPNFPPAAMLAILDEKRPARPAHPQLTNELWKLMKICWDHDPIRRPEISAVLKSFRSSPSFSSDWASDFSTPCTYPQFTESETTEPPDSPNLPHSGKDHEPISVIYKSYPTGRGETAGRDEGESTQGLDNSQTDTRHAASSETTSRNGEEQGEISSIFTGLSPFRRGTDQSVQTPLPVDPPQFNFDQRHSLVNGYPRANGSHPNLPTCRENNDVQKEDAACPHMDGGSSRSSLHDDSANETAATRQTLPQGGTHGTSRSVFTLPEPHHVGKNQNSKSQNPSQLDLPDSTRNRSQLSLEATGKNSLSNSPSSTPLPGSNSSARASRRELQSETKPRCSFGRAEQIKPQFNGTSPTLGTSKGTQDQQIRTDSGRNINEKGGSRRSSGVTASSSQKDGGIWYRIKRILGCVSDENTTA